MSSVGAYLAETGRLYVAVSFLWAAAAKAMAPDEITRTIGELVPAASAWARSIAAALIALEALVGLGCSVGGAPARVAMALALGLLAAFTAMLTRVLVRRQTIACNCFGAGADPISAHDLIRNGLLIGAGSAWLLAAPRVEAAAQVYLPLAGVAIIVALISAHLRDIARVLS